MPVPPFLWGFAFMQIPIGIALDIFGPRSTVLITSVFTVFGAVICAVAQKEWHLIFGQALVGIGCAPALMAALFVTARRWPTGRFAAISGIVFAAGGAGMVLTGTPLAWVIENWSWRAPFLLLALLSVAVTLATAYVLEADPPAKAHGKLSRRLIEAVIELRPVIIGPTASALIAMGLVSYGATIAFRGLWIVPLFLDRHHISLIQAGNVALAVSILMTLAPALVGKLDPGEKSRSALIAFMAFALAAILLLLAVVRTEAIWFDLTLSLLFAIVSGYPVLGYAQVRSVYPPDLIGRAFTAFNMSMFLGAAATQSLSGMLGSTAQAHRIDPIEVVLLFLAATVVLGMGCYIVLSNKRKPKDAR
jgi:MFS family permease